MNHRTYFLRPLLSAILLVGLLAGPLRAQQAEPLQKSDLVRLLSGTNYTKAEVAEIVRNACLSFTPTSRDIADFRALGADDAVLTAIDRCARAGSGPAEISVARRVWEIRAGTDSLLVVRLRRGEIPVGGALIVLRGSEQIVGGPGRDLGVRTDDQGRAFFRLAAGDTARDYVLSLDAPDTRTTGSVSVRLRTLPGAPAAVQGAGESVRAGGDAEASISGRLVDAFGNAVPGRAVSARAGATADAPTLATATSGADGGVTLRVPAGALRGVERVGLFADSTRLAVLRAEFRPQPAALVVAAGAGQSADAGEALPAPVVVEARDAGGRPVPGAEVRFTAENATVTPESGRTGSDGRIEATLVMGRSGTEAVLTASAGSLSTTERFPITRGGRTAEELDRMLDTADRRLAAGDAAGALDLYTQVLEASPFDERARMGRGRAALVAGRPAEAEAAFESVIRQSPERVDAWLGLGDARRAAGDETGARGAYEQALTLEPANADARAALEGARSAGEDRVVEGDVWGGKTFDNSRDLGLRYAELVIRPVPAVELRGTYDDMLGFRHPWMVRGRDDIEGFYGAAGLRWGREGRLRTEFEAGRRSFPSDSDLSSTTWALTQEIGFGSAGGAVRIGGLWERWYDRDDVAFFGDARVPVSPVLALRPSLSYANEVGSNIGNDVGPGSGRTPEREVRAGLGLRYESPTGWSVEPALAYGKVTSYTGRFEGGLFDATLRLGVRLGVARLQGFLRYQSPPETPSFWTVAVGLGFGVPRGGP